MPGYPVAARPPVADQRGMGLLSFMVAVAVCGLLGRLLLQLAPLYLNHARLVASLESLRSRPEWQEWTREEILDALRKRWEIDSVEHVSAREVSIDRDAGGVQVRVSYDVVRPFFRNVDLLVHFDASVEGRRP